MRRTKITSPRSTAPLPFTSPFNGAAEETGARESVSAATARTVNRGRNTILSEGPIRKTTSLLGTGGTNPPAVVCCNCETGEHGGMAESGGLFGNFSDLNPPLSALTTDWEHPKAVYHERLRVSSGMEAFHAAYPQKQNSVRLYSGSAPKPHARPRSSASGPDPRIPAPQALQPALTRGSHSPVPAPAGHPWHTPR